MPAWTRRHGKDPTCTFRSSVKARFGRSRGYSAWLPPERFEAGVSGGSRWLDVESHTYLAVYKDEVDLRLAWGMTADKELTFDGWDFPDRSIERQHVDGFWRGSLITRWPVLSVDGYRCFLPSPYQSVVETGALPLRIVKSSERPLGRARLPLRACCSGFWAVMTGSSTLTCGGPMRSSFPMRIWSDGGHEFLPARARARSAPALW